MPDALDKQLDVADVYADALFGLAEKEGKIVDVRHELEELVKLAASEPDFTAFLTSSALDDDHRAAGLEKMFRGRLSDLTLNTLQIMNRNGRTDLFGALLKQYVVRLEAAANQLAVTVTSAVALDDQQQRSVTETAAHLSGKQPVVKYQVDPEIIGGLIIQMGDWRYDNSVRRQLNVARGQLRERSDRGFEGSGNSH